MDKQEKHSSQAPDQADQRGAAQRRHFIALGLALGIPGLGHTATPAPAATATQAPPGSPAPAEAPAPLLVLGDSLSAEYGLPRGQGWVAQLAQRMQSNKFKMPVVNASVSGETTSGGRSRLPALLKLHQPAIVVIELGGNDALRGLALQSTQANLTAMVKMATKAGAKVLLVGMQVPPNYGAAYTRQFEEMFTKVAKEENVPLVPFLLTGIGEAAATEKWFQADRIHPNASAQPKMLDNVWPVLKPLL